MGTDPKIVGTVPGFVGTGPCMALELPAYGSIFVVFRSQQAATLPGGDSSVLRSRGSATLPGPWSVVFDPAWGGPAASVIFDSLVDWTTRPEPGIRHYSGTATYRTTFDAPPEWKKGMPVQIDLGRVENVATVFVNGKLSGTAWTAPFAVTATNVKEKGNELEVRVTNLWPNRLIYDAGLPEAERLTRTNINPYKPTDPLLPSGLLGPVRISVISQP